MDLDGVGISSGAVAAQPLSHLPIDILVGIFGWIEESSIDRCLLKQTCSRIKWVLAQHLKSRPKIDPSLPFAHELATILPYLPKPSANNRSYMKLHCVKQGMLANFKILHTIGGSYSKSFVLASAHAGHLECTLGLLDMTPPADRPTFRNEALQFASNGGHLGLVQQLIKLGARVQFNCDTAVTNAAAGGHLELVKYLHQQDVDVFTTNNTPLRAACERGHLAVVQYLVNGKGHLEVVKYLWSQGVGNDPNSDARRLISAACSIGHLEIVQFLYSVGLRAATGDPSPIYVAADGGHVELVRWLIAKGANRDVTNGSSFVAACRTGIIELVRLLYSSDLSDDSVMLGFETACLGGHLEVAQFISALPISIGIPKINRVLAKACKNGHHWDIVELLHSLGADVQTLSGYAVKSACKDGRLDMVKLLDPLGVNSFIVNGEALVVACESGNLELVTYLYALMESSVLLATVASALFVAVCARHYPIVDFLRSVGADMYVEDGLYMSYAFDQDDVDLAKYLWTQVSEPEVYKSLKINVRRLCDKYPSSQVTAYFRLLHIDPLVTRH